MPAKTIIHMHYKAFASGPYANSCDGAEQQTALSNERVDLIQRELSDAFPQGWPANQGPGGEGPITCIGELGNCSNSCPNLQLGTVTPSLGAPDQTGSRKVISPPSFQSFPCCFPNPDFTVSLPTLLPCQNATTTERFFIRCENIAPTYLASDSSRTFGSFSPSLRWSFTMLRQTLLHAYMLSMEKVGLCSSSSHQTNSVGRLKNFWDPLPAWQNSLCLSDHCNFKTGASLINSSFCSALKILPFLVVKHMETFSGQIRAGTRASMCRRQEA